MPNRIIKESIAASEKIASLSDFEFRVWVALITLADDYGRGDARTAIIKGRAFPLRESVTQKNIDTALHSLASKNCVSLYSVGGRPYFCFPTWSEHQRVRTRTSKYPGPEESDRSEHSAESCGNSPQLAADCGLNPIQSESNPNQNQNPNTTARARGDGAFDRFWVEYPKKVGKGQAQKAFSKVSVPVETLIEAVQRQRNSVQWQKDGGQYIPNPATWLNQRRWEDDLDSLNMGGGVTHGGTFPNSGPIIEKLPAASDGWWDD